MLSIKCLLQLLVFVVLVIYIPLCYLLNFFDFFYHFLQCNLHSTMLSIKYLFDLRLCTRSNHLHSTMLSIKFCVPPIKFFESLIYIPLCYLLNFICCKGFYIFRRIYIPLCYLLNLPVSEMLAVGQAIYIPLCYLLNPEQHEDGAFHFQFTFHYVIY